MCYDIILAPHSDLSRLIEIIIHPLLDDMSITTIILNCLNTHIRAHNENKQ